MQHNDSPLLSVIVPVYNVVQYIDRCIESILDQTYQEMEIILVDDGSTDGSGERCDYWAGRDARITVIHKKNEGLVSARQAGARVAVGMYISQIDSDDWIESSMYTDMMALALDNDADMVTSGLIREYSNHTSYGCENAERGVYKEEKLANLKKHIVNVNHFFESKIYLSIVNKIIKRELLLKYLLRLPKEACAGEDFAVAFPCIFLAKCIVVTGKSYYHYLIRHNSMTGNNEDRTTDLCEVEKCLYQFIDNNVKKAYDVIPQIRHIMTYCWLVFEPEQKIEIKDGYIWPFDNLKVGERVVFYGTGKVGKKVSQYFQSTGLLNIVAYADKTFSKGIIRPEEIINYEFDKVVIAVANAYVADEIENMLIRLGIEQEKISRFKMFQM